MDRKRVLFFGVTGVEKASALDNLARWAERHRSRRPRPRCVDFEGSYLFKPERGGKEWYSFLDDQQETQREAWRRLWAEFLRSEVFCSEDSDLFVGVHGCIVRGHYGVRCVIEPRDLAQWVDPQDSKNRLRPDLIVTLLDDVYDMWWRTEARAGGEQWKGRPTVEQLLFARRAELIAADQVAYSVDPPIPHFMVSVAHPCETLANRVYSANPTVVYLCFPISAPRDLKKKNDSSGEAEIVRFLSTAYERQHRNPDLVVVCPLGIDELPLLTAMEDEHCGTEVSEGEENVPAVRFDRDSLRWAMGSLWPTNDCLSPEAPSSGERLPIPLAQLRAAAGMIHTDVGWRDYRLVEQAKIGCLAAFNPKFKNRDKLSRSVLEEIRFAAGNCPVYVYQDPAHDPLEVFESQYPQGGTMPPGPWTQMVVRKDTVDAVFDAVEDLVKRKRRS